MLGSHHRRTRSPLQPKPIAAAWIALAVGLGVSAGVRNLDAQDLGEQMFQAVCAACHGPDGKGGPGTEQYQIPLPDFTECTFNSREPDSDFFAVAYAGGPVRGFSEVMPAHGGSLSDEQIQAALDYIRGFCTDDRWPRGELNLPRPFLTEKAYPEDEAVLTTAVDVEGEGAVLNTLLYEKRFGPASQFEIELPFGYRESTADDGGWNSGIGDLALGVKHTLAHDLEGGYILSLGGEVVLPTGDEATGFGKGTTVFEPYLSFGKILPSDAFLHLQGLVEIPADGDEANTELKWRSALGKSFTEDRFGRTWSPMVELVGTAEFEDDETEYSWDVVPQMQVTLNTRQHVMLNVGLQLPLTDGSVRDTRILVYLLWDWFDGGFFDGW